VPGPPKYAGLGWRLQLQCVGCAPTHASSSCQSKPCLDHPLCSPCPRLRAFFASFDFRRLRIRFVDHCAFPQLLLPDLVVQWNRRRQCREPCLRFALPKSCAWLATPVMSRRFDALAEIPVQGAATGWCHLTPSSKNLLSLSICCRSTSHQGHVKPRAREN
jgi:hypothetical protein